MKYNENEKYKYQKRSLQNIIRICDDIRIFIKN